MNNGTGKNGPCSKTGGAMLTLLPTEKLCHSLQIFAAWKSSDNDGVVKGGGRKLESRRLHGDRNDELDRIMVHVARLEGPDFHSSPLKNFATHSRFSPLGNPPIMMGS